MIFTIVIILMGLVNLINYAGDTNLIRVLEWLNWLPLYVFVNTYHAVIMSVLIVIMMFQYVKDWRVLVGIGVIVGLFFQFVI